MKRGEVWRVSLAPRSGSEQRGERPAIVVSSDVLNGVPGWRSIVVIPVSSSGRQAARGPTAVPLPAGAGGLTLESVALCHQITTLDRSKFLGRMGMLDAPSLHAVLQGLLIGLDIDANDFASDL